MTVSVPRIVFAAPSSGSGKTTAVCAVLELLRRRGLKAASFKCGPDYIDPMFHRAVLGIDGSNLDPFFCDGKALNNLLCGAEGADIAVIEGVMGYYDGTGSSGTDNSTYTVASETASPVILVLDGRGAAASLLAVIEGFVNFAEDSGIKGVLFSRVSEMTYRSVSSLMRQRFGNRVKPLGYIPKLPEDCVLKSRHLGLVTAPELQNLRGMLENIANACENTVDIDGILDIAAHANAPEKSATVLSVHPPVTIAAARDDAFCFYYRDTIRMFESMGAQFVHFSPLSNEPVPEDADGLMLGGGYPELYAEQLEANAVTRESIVKAVSDGMPVIAECGGFQYLGASLEGRRMCGVLPHESVNTGKLVRFGYVTLTAEKNGLLGDKGMSIKAHEFHYFDSTQNGSDFTAVKPNGRKWSCAVMTDSMYAGYPHLYLPSCPDAAENYYRKCLQYKAERKHG